MAGRRSNEQIITDLVTEGASLLAAAHEHNTALTATYKALADVIVNLRARFKDSTGEPDWRGRSQDYRNAVATMYEESGVPADSQSNMQAAIRYHIGNALRERLSAEELAKAGLKAEGPLERSRGTNNRRREAASGDDLPEDAEEWFEDTVTTLKSIEDEHPEVVIIDLRDPSQDVLPMLHKCLAVLQAAHLEGVTTETRAACVAVLDQVIAEAVAFRTEAQVQVQVQEQQEPAREEAPARGGRRRQPATA